MRRKSVAHQNIANKAEARRASARPEDKECAMQGHGPESLKPGPGMSRKEVAG